MSSISNCLDGDLELWDEDRGRRCLGPLLCFERDLLDDEGVSLTGMVFLIFLRMNAWICLVNFRGGMILVSDPLMCVEMLMLLILSPHVVFARV